MHIRVSVPDPQGSDGTVWNHLVAGVREDAGDGFDALDTPSMLEPDDPVQALFTHGAMPEDRDSDGMIDGWKCESTEEGYNIYQCSLWRDMRTFDAEKVWSFLVLSPLNGDEVTLQWTFDDYPENIEVVLADLSNPAGNVDMGNERNYSYTNHFEPEKKYGIRYFEIRMKAAGLFIAPPDLPDATIDTPYIKRLTAIGGVPVWSLGEGELPPGMYIDAYTGDVTGVPTATGSYRFTVRGDDPVSGYGSSREYALNINSPPVIEETGLPDGMAGTVYNAGIAVTGGSAPVAWGIRGNLPEGLTLDSNTGIISGTLQVPGIYPFTVTVKDANDAEDSRDFGITVTEPGDEYPPDAIRDLRGIYTADTSVLLIWSAPSDDSITGTAALYDLRYIENCPDITGLNDGTWDNAAEAGSEPRPQKGAMQTYTLTGLNAGKNYCIAVKGMDAKGHVSPISNIVMLPLSSGQGSSGFSELSSSLTLTKGYNLISLPLIPVPNRRDLLFGEVLGDTIALYRWYSAYPGITEPQYYSEDILMPGLGYFLYSPLDNLTVDIEGLKIEEAGYTVALQKGWNMIGTPYHYTILMSDLSVKNSITNEIKTYNDAVITGWIGNTVYRIKNGNYDFASFNDESPAVLEPWVGYWIYVNERDGVEIIFRSNI